MIVKMIVLISECVALKTAPAVNIVKSFRRSSPAIKRAKLSVVSTSYNSVRKNPASPQTSENRHSFTCFGRPMRPPKNPMIIKQNSCATSKGGAAAPIGLKSEKISSLTKPTSKPHRAPTTAPAINTVALIISTLGISRNR